ncbi:class I poly(R)-hydroxyalkanoic acid synthase [Sphingorhabdus lutea]|uniref:Class I poly(R)-hydroxyalkanoic acid synthase n=1 Tax=Sphingorhabdus lutea TaxID=1913578 RepID=A0A1L3JAH3_9SPHN|nr:alpha/beta fold hydrolase [Sphingorhabdus lutea]APG62127.1 class I poly(R)-hydroxyalkanoic acid synthase [Sphingorhabdus lutea]
MTNSNDDAGNNGSGNGFAFGDIGKWAEIMTQMQQQMFQMTPPFDDKNNETAQKKAQQSSNDKFADFFTPMMQNFAGMANAALPLYADMMQGNLVQGKAAGNSPFLLKTPNGQDIEKGVQQITNLSAHMFDFMQFISKNGGQNWQAAAEEKQDRRFAHEQWVAHPMFNSLRQLYQFMDQSAQQWLDQKNDLNDKEKEALSFQMRGWLDSIAPNNFLHSNPEALEAASNSNGETLRRGIEHMMADIQKGQLTHSDPNSFILGENIAITPGKVIHRSRLFELIQYSPSTKNVNQTPLVIFPPWINRFYILDLNPQKSFVKWAVEQGLTVFMVSWKSADADMADVIWDDYVAAQLEAIDVIRDVLDVPSVHAIGYCVAGTTLSASLAYLHSHGQADKVKSATFFTAQIDFTEAGDLLHFTSDQHMEMLEQLSSNGYLDGRVMAATFNLLRGKDLIWNTVVNHYLLGKDYPAFDLLYWNGDTTNLPRSWHKSYLSDLYRDNLLVEPNRLSVIGTPIDLRIVKTPTYIQAGREDHIAPAKSVWKMQDHFSGPMRFVLAGSGHIAGVVNPPSSEKYQYWVNEGKDIASLDEYIAGAVETKGSWWPDWINWLCGFADMQVKAQGARIPGEGKLPALCDSPGLYVTLK